MMLSPARHRNVPMMSALGERLGPDTAQLTGQQNLITAAKAGASQAPQCGVSRLNMGIMAAGMHAATMHATQPCTQHYQCCTPEVTHGSAVGDVEGHKRPSLLLRSCQPV